MKFNDEFWNLNAIIRTDKKTRTVYFVDGTTLELKTNQEFEVLRDAIFHHETMLNKKVR